MTALTQKQRTAINATLALIHSAGHDASAISKQAKAAAANGVPLNTAYDRAIEGFMATAPDMAGPITKVARLVMASSPATVAQYDRAINAYNATGDEGPLNALAPIIARDSIALAIHHGELAPGATGAGALTAALGGETSPMMLEALTAPAPAVAAPDAAPQAIEQPAPQSFSFRTGEHNGAPSAPAPTARRGWARGHGGGFVSPKSVAKWQREYAGGIVPEGARLAPHEQNIIQ